MEMVLQNVIWPDEVCGVHELYFRTDGFFDRAADCVKLKPGECLSTDTYMNCLDISHWKRFTTVKQTELKIEAKGEFRLTVILREAEAEKTLLTRTHQLEDRTTIKVFLELGPLEGILYYLIEAIGKVWVYGSQYSTEDTLDRQIYIALDICTFHRNIQVERNLVKLEKSLFFDRNSPLCGRMKVFITDNGDDFSRDHEDSKIRICRNSNRGGGTGGFARGLEEIRRGKKDFPSTHTIFMDDDVEFQTESFFRLFSFLSFLRPEYADWPVAGRMFRLDDRRIQYTAAENWNGGQLTHSGGNLDMTLRKNVISEELSGEYGGWWLCAYPNSVTDTQNPFPFYFHCDDAEYGLRTGKQVLVLRGFQVWHETYKYRLNNRVLYYDHRNPMVVNALQGLYRDAGDIIRPWKQKLDQYHNEGKYAEKYLCALALWHFGTGTVFEKRFGQIPEYQLNLAVKPGLARIAAALIHRRAERYVRRNFCKIMKHYQKKREESIWH